MLQPSLLLGNVNQNVNSEVLVRERTLRSIDYKADGSGVTRSTVAFGGADVLQY